MLSTIQGRYSLVFHEIGSLDYRLFDIWKAPRGSCQIKNDWSFSNINLAASGSLENSFYQILKELRVVTQPNACKMIAHIWKMHVATLNAIVPIHTRSEVFAHCYKMLDDAHSNQYALSACLRLCNIHVLFLSVKIATIHAKISLLIFWNRISKNLFWHIV